MRQVSALFVVAAALAGCPAATVHRDTLDSRASFDLRCPQAQLKVTEIDLHTAGVDGCGQRATYIYNEVANTWVLNSPPADSGPPPGGATTPPGPPPGEPPPPAAPPH
jgi:hypothetical protein